MDISVLIFQLCVAIVYAVAVDGQTATYNNQGLTSVPTDIALDTVTAYRY